ncbi:ornithine carbamoyltransferase [Planctellipticum variicoloris]|uniref:ornithine carbamoyltransferase n=1 Tax=Planctellipticum variicoloris TaxID=3064265 RepID=UPI003013CE69|nr:ornithine carbamoyltransferase [Planctomycetaceae bacterium SH412]
MRHLNSLLELRREDVDAIFSLARVLKVGLENGQRPPLLAGRVLTQVFEKPSLRTRVSFEAAMMQLGGSSIFLPAKDAGLGGREAIRDVARVLGGYSDVIVLRTFSQQLIDDFVAFSGTSVINGLSDLRHPCQALTDLFTMQEAFGEIRGRKFVFVGDGNNVAASLATACAMLEVPMTVCTPNDYRLPDDFLVKLRLRCPKAEIEQTSDLKDALKDASIVYTDVWTSMGQEAEDGERQQVLGPFQVNAQVMRLAPRTARFMHCLPAKRGREVTDEVIDGPQSIVFQQADNRMHLAKGLFCWVLEVTP